MKTNIALYQESLKSDQVDYETPYESVGTDFYRELITGVIHNPSARILDLGCFKGILVDKLSDYSTVGLDVTTAVFTNSFNQYRVTLATRTHGKNSGITFAGKC